MKVTGESFITNKDCRETVGAVIDEKASSSCEICHLMNRISSFALSLFMAPFLNGEVPHSTRQQV